jgi:hypothetical protein
MGFKFQETKPKEVVSRLICRTTNQAPKIYGAPVPEA